MYLHKKKVLLYKAIVTVYIYMVTVANVDICKGLQALKWVFFWGKMCKSSIFFYFPRIDAVALGRTSCFPIQGFLLYIYIYLLMIAKKKKKNCGTSVFLYLFKV